MRPKPRTNSNPSIDVGCAAFEVAVVRTPCRGRVRLAVPRIKRDRDAAQSIERLLLRLPGVKECRASPLTGRILVRFEAVLSVEDVCEWLLERRQESVVHEQPWHAMAAADVTEAWEVAPLRGLSTLQVLKRRQSYGFNALPQPQPRGPLRIWLDQFESLPVLLLAASAGLSLATGGVLDAALIMGVVGLNAAIGFVTDSQSEKTLAALARAVEPFAVVLRDGEERTVEGPEVVPGDIIRLRRGSYVPADARLLESDRLSIDESVLTGESHPVTKSIRALAFERTPLADRLCMVHRGTVVTGGSGTAVVVATGPWSQVGRIQVLAEGASQPATPLQTQLETLGTQLVLVSAAACGVVFVLGLLRGQSLVETLKTAVSLAVAAVPEGLPTVATTTLALGVRELERRNVFVRKLSAVESLGAVQTVCLDKTGTITCNRMTFAAAACGDTLFAADERGLARKDGAPLTRADQAGLNELFELCTLCSEVEALDDDSLHGTPTEVALVKAARRFGVDVAAIKAGYPRLQLLERTQDRNYMVTVHESEPGTLRVAVKGRPAEVLELCDRILGPSGRVQPLTQANRQRITADNERMAGQALRVLGIATTTIEDLDHMEAPLAWVGLAGVLDPPRPGMAELLTKFHRAGIHTTMITGDQSATALAVARTIGLAEGDTLEVLDSTRIDRIDRDVLRSLAPHVDVFSRVSPAHKLQIVQALQQSEQVVAMTGDGVNDGPALRAADVGIAMGRAGADVARDVADIVVGDDDLSTLVGGIEQGRRIYDDIKKAVHFILSSNTSELLITTVSVAAGTPPPLNAMQLLWINLLTDVFPELALSVEPAESDVMTRPPRTSASSMFTRRDLRQMAVEGGLLTAAGLAAYGLGASRYGIGPRSKTMAFNALTWAQLLHAISCRSQPHSIFDRDRLPRNPYLPAAVGGGVALQALGTLVPWLRGMLGTARLGFSDWFLCGAAAAVPLVVNETLKLIGRPDKDGAS